MNARATWKGSLHVSLLALRVKAYTSTTTQQEKIHLHQLHRECQSRIRYQKICPLHGPLESDQIVMGYEHAPHDHVEIDLSELDRLRSQHELRAIRIATFVETGRITPLYYGERHYYLLPDGPAAQLSYSLLLQAMLARNAEAVAHVVLAKREQLVLLRPLHQKLLVMTCLKYAAQVRLPEVFAEQLEETPPVSKEELQLAESLITQRTCANFDLSDYKDAYAEKLIQLVDAKLQGRELPTAQEEQPGQILSLIEALQASVQQASPAVGSNGSVKKQAVKRRAVTRRAETKRTMPRKGLAQRKPRTATSRKRAHKKSA